MTTCRIEPAMNHSESTTFVPVLTVLVAKPYLVVQLDAGAVTEVAVKVLSWQLQHGVKTLNVAGPRESKRPGIHRLTGELLQAVDAASRSSDGVEGANSS